MNAHKMFNGLLAQASMLPEPHNSPQEHPTSPEFPGEGGHRSLAILLAVVLALPAIGMIASGFISDRPWVGGTGVGIFVGMVIFYSVVALLSLMSLG